MRHPRIAQGEYEVFVEQIIDTAQVGGSGGMGGAWAGAREPLDYARCPDGEFVSLYGRIALSCSARAASATSVS
jgi:hypothetical protein